MFPARVPPGRLEALLQGPATGPPRPPVGLRVPAVSGAEHPCHHQGPLTCLSRCTRGSVWPPGDAQPPSGHILGRHSRWAGRPWHEVGGRPDGCARPLSPDAPGPGP